MLNWLKKLFPSSAEKSIAVRDAESISQQPSFSRTNFGASDETKKVAGILFESAFAAHGAGRLTEAEEGYRKMLAVQSNHADALNMLGVLHIQKGDPNEAEKLIRRALGIREDAAFLSNLGNLLQENNRLAEAESAFRRALFLRPDFADAHFWLGNLLKDTNQLPEAESALRRAIEIRPDFAGAHYNLGLLLQEGNRLPEAEIIYRCALAAKPDFAEVHNNLGLLFQETNRLPEAENAYRSALEAMPDSADALYNLGNLLKDTNRLFEAENAYLRALAVRPDFVDACNNLGILFKNINRLAEAENAYRRALAARPEFAEARYNLGNVLLSQGRYTEAWPYYESRYDPSVKNSIYKAPALPYQQWRGQSLAGKSMLIWPEQGFGDYIQFVRYASLLKDRGVSRLTLVCQPALKTLLETVQGVDSVVTDLAAIAPHDYWSLPLSLPLHFGTTVATIPAALPYVHVLPERAARWRDRLPLGRRTVGLAWKGNPLLKNDSNRSLPELATLAPLWNVPGMTFVSLQKGPGEEEAMSSPATQPVIALGSDISDFADTAAIVAQLDLVICVDTAVAHLAGAMGKPCWMLLPAFGTDWRWMTDRVDSPWYPGTMRLFRQSTSNNWDDAINELVTALENWA